jgi:acetyltransferase-like isoleucine patch superfamily enzyme
LSNSIIKNIRHRLKLYINNIRVAFKYDVLIEKSVTIKYIDSISFGTKCTLQSGVYLYGSRSDKKVIFGNDVVIASNVMILGEGGVDIGDASHLGPNVVLTTQYGDRNNNVTYLKYKPVKLGKGSWIGSGSVIMPGAVLGSFCSVAPNSVVFGAWGDHCILGGNPAREIGASK